MKAEKDNAEVRVDNVAEYQKVVDAEWDILYDKLDRIHKSGAKVKTLKTKTMVLRLFVICLFSRLFFQNFPSEMWLPNTLLIGECFVLAVSQMLIWLDDHVFYFTFVFEFVVVTAFCFKIQTRTMKACGGSIQSTVHDLNDDTLGGCDFFEEKQVRF